jgi:hypothetical protein
MPVGCDKASAATAKGTGARRGRFLQSPNRKISTSFRIAFSAPTASMTKKVTRVRPMPLKNPDSAHSATANGPPSRRGIQ